MTVREKLAAARKIEKGTVQRKPSPASTSPVLAPIMAQQAAKSPTMQQAVKAATQTTQKSTTTKKNAAKPVQSLAEGARERAYDRVVAAKQTTQKPTTAKASAAKPASGASTYLTGGSATPAPSYAAGVQARELKELDIKPREKKTSTAPQKAQAPAWQGLMNLSSEELEQRHEKAKAERDALSDRVEREKTQVAESTYAAVAGRYKAKETNPIPSVAAASGVWDSKAYEDDKRVNSLRMDVSRKQEEVNDLAAAHYHRKNQEQFAKLETDAVSKSKFRSAQELATDLDTISKALSAPTAYNGMDTRFQSDGENLKRKYGVNDLQALQRTLTAQKEGLVKELEAKGYDFETMAGYDLMLRQQEEYIKRQEKTQKEAEEHPGWASGLSVVLKPLQVADFARTSFNSVGHSNADDLGSYVPANVYDMYTTNMVQTIRSTVSKKIEENTDWEIFGRNVGSFLYNTGMSMADSAFLMTTLGAGGTYIMGLSAAAEKSKEIIEQGGSNSQAFWGGVTAGVAEYVFEKFSVENLLKIKGVEGWKAKVKAALRQGGIEASEEMLTECANIISDAMVMGERSGMATAINEYQKQGMTEDKAVLQACLDSIGQVAVAGAGGFISGVGMAGGKLAINQAGSAIYNRLTQNQQTMIPAIQGTTEAQKTATDGVAGLPKMTMADFTDVDSPVWRNVDYADTETKRQITQDTHQQMVSEGRVVQIPESTIQQVGQSFPDLRTQKKEIRNATLRQRFDGLKMALREFLGRMKGTSFDFEVNGNVLEATLYGTGIREVMEKVTQDKASMLYHSAEIFDGAQYLYSTPDYNGDPNIYRWNYFYTPVQIGEETVGVRIAVRDMVPSAAKKMDSQIYSWGIKKDVTLDGGGPGQSPNATGVSSATSSDTSLDGGGRGPKVASPRVSSDVPSTGSIPQTAQDVNQETGKDMAAPASQPVDPLIADIRSRGVGQMASQPVDPLIADIRSRGTGQTVTQPVDPLIADIRARGAKQTTEQGDKAEAHTQVDDELKTITEDGKITSGAISGALNPISKAAAKHAKTYYGLVRSMSEDCKKIASHTGFSESDIRIIKDYLFIEEHDLSEGHKQFDPDYDIAQSWQRLMEGTEILPHDITLLNHELLEMELTKQGYSQDEAHEIASETYNYAEEVKRYHGKAGAGQAGR